MEKGQENHWAEYKAHHENKDNSGENQNSDTIKIRKDKILKIVKNPTVWVVALLIVALILGVYIRALPMKDHGGNPGLWDVTTNDWTLGPDLDPWLFTRYAKHLIEDGKLPEIDNYRNVPLGFDTSKETVLLPKMIAWTHKIVQIFKPEANVEFSAALFPVIMFGLTIIVFFFFVREIFIKKSKESKLRGNIIGLVATFLMIVSPVFLSRTIAGIPEKESAAFFFLFLALFFFLKSWKVEKIKKSTIFGVLAGLSTALMGFISGLFIIIYLSIFVSGFISFIANKFGKKETISYFSWWISSALLFIIFPGKISFVDLVTSLTTIPAFFLFVLLIVHSLIWKTKLKENKYLKKIKLPQNIISIIIAFLFLLVGILILQPSLIIDKLSQIGDVLFKPTTGRWNTTVAENRQPYFSEWVKNFGPLIKNIPLTFWLFFAGSVVLFKKMLNKIKKKDSWKLTGFYVLFLFGLIFSRYSSSSLFNGENFISKVFFVLSVFLLFGSLIYYYFKYNKEGNKDFEKIDYGFLLLLSLSTLAIFSARSAIRLVMVVATVVPIFMAYLIDYSTFSFLKSKKEKKVILGIIMVFLVVLTIFSFVGHYKSIKSQSYNLVPSGYNQQWQHAMDWVRENTSEDSVFAHWWDYGYWIQSIGNRATVLDGGNAITFWNYHMGRLVLTGDNQQDSLEFLYNHDANYLLIDSTDVGKYGAFSIIGSDENYDRLSFIQTMQLDTGQIRETSEGMILTYLGGIGLDEDIVYDQNGTKIFLPSESSGLGGVFIESTGQVGNRGFRQPKGIFVNNGQRYDIPIRYLEYKGEFLDFGSGLEGTIKIVDKLEFSGSSVSLNDLGSIIYISPRVMRGYLGQKYLLNDPFNRFPNFEISHIEDNLLVDNLRNQGLPVGNFVQYQGLQGPIKIWKINYTGKEKEVEEYLSKDASAYLPWKL